MRCGFRFVFCKKIIEINSQINANFYCFSVTNNRGHSSIEPVQCLQTDSDVSSYSAILNEINDSRSSIKQIRIFRFEHVRYMYNYRIERFVRMQNLDEVSTTNQLMNQSNQNGIDTAQRDAL